MGSKEEYKHDNKNDTQCLYGLMLVKCPEGFSPIAVELMFERRDVCQLQGEIVETSELALVSYPLAMPQVCVIYRGCWKNPTSR